MGELDNRRSQANETIEKFRGRLAVAEGLVADKACIYATGSFGRLEASKFSDLDVFIFGRSGDKQPRLLSRLDEICLKAELIEAAREFKFPEFSDDGKYVVHYSVYDFTHTLGTPEDDVTNTFTARLLLLLESRVLIGDEVYKDGIEDVIAAYWRDYEDHKTNFVPAFLANDVLRLWRTFCVNYEARTERIPDREKAKGKIKNYKLKHSRLLTCYSGILYLLAVFGKKGTVSPQDALTMIGMTPTERLQWLGKEPTVSDARPTISKLLAQYEQFLETTNVPGEELIDVFMEKPKSNEYMKAAYHFGDSVYEILTCIGKGSIFHRLLVV